MVLQFIAVLAVAFILTALLGKLFIPVLMSKKLGQPIKEIGPRWHKSKEGTPTMGGIFIIAAVAAALCFSFIFCDRGTLIKLWITFGAAVLFGLIGFVDDFKKLFRHTNDGLRAHEKFLLQLAVSFVYLTAMRLSGNLSTVLLIPFTEISIDFCFFYYIIAAFFICGIVNAVNLTDGIDGLASSVTASVCAFFAVVAFSAASSGSALLSGAIFGACLGFLVYNANPARVFMGDTGSLFLGGAVCGLAFLSGSPLTVIFVGIVYIIETLSVILQVVYFKLSHGKRIFKMAPIHHHFELCGWSENKIVLVSVLITAVFSVIMYFFS